MGLGTESSGETHPSGGAHWENTMGRGVQGGKCKWRAVGRRGCFPGMLGATAYKGKVEATRVAKKVVGRAMGKGRGSP